MASTVLINNSTTLFKTRDDIISKISSSQVFNQSLLEDIRCWAPCTFGRVISQYKKGIHGLLFVIQNAENIQHLYFDQGHSADTLITTLEMNTDVESLRTNLTRVFRKRNDAELEIRSKWAHRLAGCNNARPDLVPAYEEWIRLYKLGVSAERIKDMFNCDASYVVEILKFNNVFFQNRDRVKLQTKQVISDAWANFSESKLNQIKQTRAVALSKRSPEERSKSRKRAMKIFKANNGITEDIINVSQHDETFQKQQKFRYYDFVLPSGRTIKIQGYEKFFLAEFLRLGGDELKVNTRVSFRYKWNDMSRLYYADFKIGNLVIEIKSAYTLNRQIEKNWAIMHHMLENKIPFCFMCYDQKGICIGVISSLEELSHFVTRTTSSAAIIQSLTNLERTIS